jgi:hypothetical protein
VSSREPALSFAFFGPIAYNADACSMLSFRSSTMLRILFLTLVLFSISLAGDCQPAEARIISRGNPGSHYNIHGMNYGSMRWERQQGNRRPIFQRGRRAFFRRR